MTLSIIVLNDYAWTNGGTSAVALHQAQLLVESGFDVTVFAAVPAPEAERWKFPIVHSGQHDILGNPDRLEAAVQGLWNGKAAQQLGRLLDSKDSKRTVVHLHSWSKALSSSVVREVLRRNLPLVCTLHDYFAACPNGAFFNHQTGKTCELTPLGLPCLATHCDSRSYKHKLWRVARQAIQINFGGLPGHIRHFIVPSRFAAEILRPHLSADAQLHVLPSAISRPDTEAKPPAARSGMAFVGRLSQEKGALLYIEACKRLGLQPQLVGDGEQRALIERMAPDAAISGWLPQCQVWEKLATLEALVFPSLCYETQGLMPLEAAALGVASIVPRQCAAAEFVVHEQTGLHFDSGDAGSLAAAMQRMRTERGLAQRLGEAAAAAFAQSPLARPMRQIEQLKDIYTSALSVAL
ncbi:MAG TPA: glycosyltransferase [Rhodocyclaceae bacterium]